MQPNCLTVVYLVDKNIYNPIIPIMKKIALLLFLLSAGVLANGQEIKKNLSTFKHLVASPRINVILSKGESEQIRLVYSNIDESKINIEVDDKTLRLYLDDARITEKSIRTDW